MTSPFDLRSALLAKHAQHVVFVHFPIALTITAIVFEWLAAWKPGPRAAALAEAAYWNLTAAAVTAVAAVATGLLAWQWQLEGGAARRHAAAACRCSAAPAPPRSWSSGGCVFVSEADRSARPAGGISRSPWSPSSSSRWPGIWADL